MQDRYRGHPSLPEAETDLDDRASGERITGRLSVFIGEQAGIDRDGFGDHNLPAGGIDGDTGFNPDQGIIRRVAGNGEATHDAGAVQQPVEKPPL